MAAHVEAQVVLRAELRRAAEAAYESAFAEASVGMRDGSLLRGEVVARWEDCMVGGELRPRRGASPRVRRRAGQEGEAGAARAVADGQRSTPRSARPSSRTSPRSRTGPPRRSKAAGGRTRPAPSCSTTPPPNGPADVRAKQVFESVFGAGRAERSGRPGRCGDQGRRHDQRQTPPVLAFSRSSPDWPCAPRARSGPGRTIWPGWWRRGPAARGPPGRVRRRGAQPGRAGGDARRGDRIRAGHRAASTPSRGGCWTPCSARVTLTETARQGARRPVRPGPAAA